MASRAQARIGPLSFPPEYSDPAVEIDTESRTVEHETMDDNVIIQTLGRRPHQIRISGVLPEDMLPTLDSLVEQGEMTVRTERWEGVAVARSTSTTFMRAKDKDNRWLYEVQITLLEIEQETELGSGDFFDILPQGQFTESQQELFNSG